MSTVYKTINEKLQATTNTCRIELAGVQAKYYTLIIQNLYLNYLKQHENIDLYSQSEIEAMLKTLESIIEEVEAESTIDGVQKYNTRESLPFIQECIQRTMAKYGFCEWSFV